MNDLLRPWEDDRTNFDRNLAVIIGIDRYDNHPDICNLSTPVSDARAIAELLKTRYDYKEENIICLFSPHPDDPEYSNLTENYPAATLEQIKTLLTEKLPNQLKPTQAERLIFYYAGHGIPESSLDGPAGSLVPQDAEPNKLDSYLSMQYLYDLLNELSCHHLLVILDCCFAGKFQWVCRKMKPVPEKVYREHYDRFIRYPAWQVITSSAYNQEAFDVVANPDNVVLAEDKRGIVQNSSHSPFALALIEGLQDDRADLIPDGVITANELITYIDQRVSELSKERQNPELSRLRREYYRGNFIFTRPGFESDKLDRAPDLDESNNPYRGLRSFEEKDADFFFGRKASIEKLKNRLSKTTLIIVQGISGSGKSSLVKAGLISYLRKNQEKHWYILDSMRPGKFPFTSLARVLLPIVNASLLDRLSQISFLDEELKKLRDRDLASTTQAKSDQDPQKENLIKVAKLWDKATPEAKFLLVQDYFDDLKTLDIPEEKQQLLEDLYNEISTTLESLLNHLQQDPQYLIKQIDNWSKQHPNKKLLLVIDQFEELITASQESQTDTEATELDRWQPFLQTLAKAIDACPNQLRVVLTLRSDFELRFRDSLLKKYWEDSYSLFEVGQMNLDELREAIEKPADKQALLFEPPELVDKLIEEVVRMPGALPLLSFTLSELYIELHDRWKKDPKTKRALTIDKDYRLATALTCRAEKEYDKLLKDFGREEGKKYQAIMRRVMLRMMTIEGSAVAKRRVPESELYYPTDDENKRREEAIERLVGVRLVVKGQESGESYVEPAHDFLVQGWQTLPIWEQKNKEVLSLQRRLTPDAVNWNNAQNEEKTHQKRIPDTIYFALDLLDRKLFPIEKRILLPIEKIFTQFAQLLQQSQESRRFLWNANPYLDVLKDVLKHDESLNEKDISEHDKWFNKVENEFVKKSIEQKRRNSSWRWRIARAVTLIISVAAVIAFYQWINAQKQLVSTIGALTNNSQELFDSNKEFDALLASLNAGKQSKMVAFGVDSHMRTRIEDALKDAVFGVKERNRLEGHLAGVNSVSFSPNGLLLASGSSDGLIKLWELPNGKEIKTLTGNSVSFSPDGRVVATDSSDGLIKLWDVSTGNEIKTLNGNSVSFSPDGRVVATGSSDGLIKLWDVSTGNEIKTLNGNSVSFSSNGLLASVNADGAIELWDISTDREITTLTGHKAESIYFSPDGRVLVSKNADSTISLWDVTNGIEIGTLSCNGFIDSISFSPNGQLLAVAGENQCLQLWTIASGKIASLAGHTNRIVSVSFSRDGRTLASASWDNTIKLWDVATGREIKTLTGHKALVNSVSFSPDGKLLASASNDKTIKLWDINPRKEIIPLDNYAVGDGISFSHDGKLLASTTNSYNNTGQPNTIKLWDVVTHKEIATLIGHKHWIRSVSFSPNGQWLASAAWDGTIGLWDLRACIQAITCTASETLESKSSLYLSDVSFSPDGRLLASSNWDWANPQNNSIQLWDVDASNLIKIFPGHTSNVNSISFSPDRKQLASASKDRTIKLWDVTVGQEPREIKTLKGHTDEVNGVSFSPDGKLLASASKDQTIKLWDVATGQEPREIKTLKGHIAPVNRVSFTGDGQWLLSGSDDRTIKIWDVATGKAIATLRGHRNEIRNISLSDDGQLLASQGNEELILWNVKNLSNLTVEELMGEGCNWMRGYLKNNPNSDRHLCDGVPVLVTSQNSTTTSPPYPSTLTPKDFSPALQAIAEDYYTRGSEQPAKKLIAKYTEIIENPDSNNADTIADAYINRGIAYSTQKDHEKAIEDYDEAIKIDPENVDAYINRGIAYSSIADHEKAIEDYRKAIEINPDDADAYYAMGFTQTLMEEKRQEAIENYQKAADLYQEQNKQKYAENARKKIEELSTSESSRSK